MTLGVAVLVTFVAICVKSEVAAWLLGGLSAGILYVWLRGTRREE